MPDSHASLAVDQQEQDADSLLNAYRAFLAFRRTQPALVKGDVDYHPVRDEVLCFERTYQQTRLLVALNFSDQTVTRTAPERAEALDDAPKWLSGEWQAGTLTLPPFGVAIARCPQAQEEDAPWDV